MRSTSYFESLQRNRSTRVVVLKGAGSSFCAGLDLKHAMARRAGQQEPPGVTESLDLQRRIADIVMLMRRCPQPIIALVQGARPAAVLRWRSPPTFASPQNPRG